MTQTTETKETPASPKPKPAPQRARVPQKMARRPYEAQKAQLQAELLKVQLWAQETGQKFVLC